MFSCVRPSAWLAVTLTVGLVGATSTPSWSSQSTHLSLADALKLAKERNGTVRAAILNARSADQQVTIANAGFLPTFTPSYGYTSSRQETRFGGNTLTTTTEGATTNISSSMRLLDSGERGYSLSSAKRSRDASYASARQTLRSTLFNVASQYYDTLRNQELLKVSEAQVNRTNEILKATEAKIATGASAPIERLQANADLQNARVDVLSSRNRVTTSAATFKGTVGLEDVDGLPTLEPERDVEAVVQTLNLKALIKEGMAGRPDLIAARRNIEASRYQQKLAERQAGMTVALDLSYNEQLTPNALAGRTASLTASFPLFDGGKSRAVARAQRLTTDAQQQTYVQTARSAQAEIESAYYSYTQNAERLTAAATARDAADENYKAAIGSQVAGAYDLLQVLQAQVSLVTAESNYIQALYDYKISAIQLNLVTGRPIPGE